MTRYESAKEIYAKLGVDTDAAIEKCMQVPVSLHCWQGDDVTGFDHDGPLTGGIQTTGNYPGKSKNTGRIDGGYGQGNEPDAGSKEDQCACVLRNF